MNFLKNKKNDSQDFSLKPIEEKDWFEAPGQLVIDLYKEKENLVIRAPLAGVKAEDINIIVENDIIIISGKREETKEIVEKNYFLKECHFGEFSREIVLPLEVDKGKIKAKVDDGILFVIMPLPEKTKSKEVEIK